MRISFSQLFNYKSLDPYTVYRGRSETYRSGSDTVFYNKCSAVTALRVYL